MSTQPEAVYKRALISAFEKTFPSRPNDPFGCDAWYNAFIVAGGNTSGVPDLRFAVYGRAIWVEAKVHHTTDVLSADAAAKLLRPTQRVAIRKMVAAGELVYVFVEVLPDRTCVFHAYRDVSKDVRSQLKLDAIGFSEPTMNIWRVPCTPLSRR